jgi:putative transposase
MNDPLRKGESMGQVYYKLFYHAVWSTFHRESLISASIEPALYAFLEGKAKQNQCFIHAVNGTENHIHVVITIPPSRSISEMIGRLKGSSSYHLNNIMGLSTSFEWQDGFGIMSVSEKALGGILKYVRRQKEHHSTARLSEDLERDSEIGLGSP